MVDPLREIQKKVDSYKEQLGEYLLAGGPRSYDEYRHAVGKVEALDYVLSDIAEIEKRYLAE